MKRLALCLACLCFLFTQSTLSSAADKTKAKKEKAEKAAATAEERAEKAEQAAEKAAGATASANVSNQKYDDIALFGRVINFVEKQYVEPVKTRDLVYGAIKGMLESLDPHSNFMPPEIYRQLKSDTSGKFGGLGIEVSVGKDSSLTVLTPMEGTPAWKAGVKPGDKIVKIDGQDTKGMSLVEAVTKMRGEPGTYVKFSVERAGVAKPIDFRVERTYVNVKSVKSEFLQDQYAYIRLSHFQEKSAEEIKQAMKSMEGKNPLKGVILDLRNNPGGLLDQAVDVTNVFVDSGVIVSTIGRNKEDKEVKTAKSGVARTDVPLVVLVNSNTASAAEIVAGAIKDHKRGLILGERTFGKGSVQTVIPLGDDVGLKLTIARYYTPNGVSIQARGIEPDIKVDDLDPATLKKVRRKGKVYREADLKKHFDNEEGDGDDKNDSSAKSDSDSNDKDDNAPRKIDPKDDYQVNQAINYLKGLGVMKEAGVKPGTK